MRNLKTLLIALVLSICSVNAQEASVSNVLNLRSAKHSGQIVENNKLVGYFIFYLKEKVDKNNTAYEIKMFDDNYNETSTFEIVRSKNSALLEMVYNGAVFMLHFYDSKNGYEFVTFDKSGEMKGANKVPKDEISNWDLNRVIANSQSGTENVTIFPNGNQGFIRSTFAKFKKTGYEIVAYDNDANIVWTYRSVETSTYHEFIDVNDVAGDYLTATISKKKNIMTNEMTNSLLILNAASGTKITEIPLGDDQSGLRSLLKSFVNENKKNITVIGEYYKPKDDILKDKSQGLYMQEISYTGEDLGTNHYAWKGDIDQFVNLDEGEKKERPFLAHFHDVIITKNGSVFMIGEQFLKQVSAAGVAMNVIAGAAGGNTNASSFEILISKMIVVQFDNKRNLVDFKTVDKKQTRVVLPKGMGLVNTTILGHYIKSMGGFDYAFTSRNKDKDIYDVVYIDANRKEDEKSAKNDLMVGVINIKNGKMTENRVPINCESSTWWIQPGKPGFISVSEYFRKEKKVTMRLEKLTY